MRAKFLKNAAGEWKGIALSPYCEFDVPERLHEIVWRSPHFAVEGRDYGPAEDKPAAPKRGRPRKVQDADAA